MQFAYLLFTSLFLVPWLILFLLRKDLRKEMLWASIITAIGGLFCEKYWYTQDWVSPITITNTLVGIEDFFMGFGAGGIGAVIFKELFKKDDYKNIHYKNRRLLMLPIILGFFIADALFRFYGLFSYHANLIGFGLIISAIFSLRRDLIKEGITGGILLSAITFPIYWTSFHFFPEWKFSYWSSPNVSQIMFLGIPYEDVVWWFIVGVNLAVVYDFNYGLRLRRVRKSLDTNQNFSQ